MEHNRLWIVVDACIFVRIHILKVKQLSQIDGQDPQVVLSHYLTSTHSLPTRESKEGVAIPLLPTRCQVEWMSWIKSFRVEFEWLLPLGSVVVKSKLHHEYQLVTLLEFIASCMGFLCDCIGCCGTSWAFESKCFMVDQLDVLIHILSLRIDDLV